MNSAIDWAGLSGIYADTGRVRIADFLNADAAKALHAMLQKRTDWLQVINSGTRLFELSRETRAQMDEEQRAALSLAIYAGARAGFQFSYETIRTSDAAEAREASTDPLAAFVIWMSTGTVRDHLRAITGATDIDFADGQATAYAPGDLLTAHDDNVAGKGRRAAYVLSLTPQWSVDWGGLLVFHQNGQIDASFMPAFNTLTLFRVPQRHSVTEVTKAAPHRRYSITGWLRRHADSDQPINSPEVQPAIDRSER